MPGMRGTIEDWQRVTANNALLARAADAEAGGVGGVARLRKDYDELSVAIAIEMVKARRKAALKFSDRAATMVADVPGIEQASGWAVAQYKARRFREAFGEGAEVADLCCGVGGDTIALCDAGLAATAIDRDPVRAWMAGQNSGGRARVLCADVADWPTSKNPGTGRCAVHLDPARRNEDTGRRVWKLDDLQPAPEQITRIVRLAEGAAVKLGPGVDLEALPALTGESPASVECIAEGNRLVQAVLWTGKLRRAGRSATLITKRDTHTLDGEPGEADVGPIARYLYAVHPAAERASLIHLLTEAHDAPLIHPKLGLLSRQTPTDSPWLTGFELLAELPWRPRKIKHWLSEHGAGIVEVKTRGKAVDPDEVARQLRGGGDRPYTVFVLRFDVQVVALVCRRIEQHV